MSTNFYWLDPVSHLEALAGQTPADPMPSEVVSVHNDDEYSRHIGKRSAAGPYCWDCDTTLCEEGSEGIHRGRSAWFEACPNCGKTAEDHGLGAAGNPAGVELGFAKPSTEKPSGVRGCSSFSWAQDPDLVRPALEALGDLPAVADEYGRVFTASDFLNMLKCQCPVQFTESIGSRFS